MCSSKLSDIKFAKVIEAIIFQTHTALTIGEMQFDFIVKVPIAARRFREIVGSDRPHACGPLVIEILSD
jgi:hypothetical protein